MSAPDSAAVALPAKNGVFSRFADFPHEQVTFFQDPDTGLKAIIAIHDTTLGPGFGGTRFYPYPDEAAALTDVLRLSRGMTYKTAVTGLPCGGAKAVIIGDPLAVKSDGLLQSYGRFVQSLGGRYVTAGDVGTSADDLDVIGRTTSYVLGRNEVVGGYGDSGAMTALGAFHALRAGAEDVFGTSDLTGRSVGVEGAGKVGYSLIHLLIDAGARVFASDVSAAARDRVLRDFPTVAVVDRVIDEDTEIYAPCALGATLTLESVANIKAAVICGAANNQLASPGVERAIQDRGITWIPDFVASAGGVTLGVSEYQGSPIEAVPAQVARIYDTALNILSISRRDGVLPGVAAESVAEDRIRGARRHPRPGYLPGD
ncbi:Glu/Leu/Phe/Val dehydrogenase [uncultured Jatrophihabitans sp.]|uniref:Glu/Leu/Phe/Val family dehydrogenase n=1 Tax=uncultured Jatrophihabitans sp. TaxID=1610747 RepID=UPI0035CA8184